MLLNCGFGEDSWESLGQQPVHLKGNQFWISIGRTNAEAEAPILWPPYAKNWVIWKDPDAGKDWRQEEKGMTEDEMVGWPSPTQWTWVWVNSGSWWWTGKPMGWQSWTGLSNRTELTGMKNRIATGLQWVTNDCMPGIKTVHKTHESPLLRKYTFQ